MKKMMIWAFFLILGVSGGSGAYAQMAAATPIKWDLNKEVSFNMEQYRAWEILNSVDLLKIAANGYVSSIKVSDPAFPVGRDIVFSDGTKRSESITQLEHQHKFMNIAINKASLPKGVTSAEITIFTKSKGDKTNIQWGAVVKGNEEGKKAMISQLTAEFDAYIAGFEKMTKSIPAAKLN
ncbi:hypothetical protein SAMN05421820_102264 [Pedobacter steynii]|uniref:Polyketide cyclase / dehydrase and lipid transport n=1 Tax=Pedobacter steynii TaxID=430522 RepID=A0A1G9NAB0_9SPHI|nr:hypothetical protein [Pedobacter steynii]NQX39362.1 hypothetical protein [Pedobacter steynii]SDL83390.1 hypothetical protein SAMN05421820_102264 [Pedobacter steynii]